MYLARWRTLTFAAGGARENALDVLWALTVSGHGRIDAGKRKRVESELSPGAGHMELQASVVPVGDSTRFLNSTQMQ
jgi:hypothetical protein